MKIIGIPLISEPLNEGEFSTLFSEIKSNLENFSFSENAKSANFEFEELNLPSNNFSLATKIIEREIEKRDTAFLIGLNHSITPLAISGFSKKYKNPGLVIFDAHTGVIPAQTNQSIQPEETSHKDYLTSILNKSIIKKENILLAASRNQNKFEYNFVRENKLRTFSQKHIQEIGIESACDAIMEFSSRFDALYISLDIDAIDPAFAPAANHIEPAGLTSREMIYFVQRLRLLKNLKFVELVEINPTKDTEKMTIKLGAKIISEFLV